MIKYKFAYNSQNQTIDVQTLSKENKTDKFRCLGCGHELVAVLGEKRVKHFRHKVITEINCSPETYLHKLAKIRFYETYQDCLTNNEPFTIKFLTFPVCTFYQKDFSVSCHLESEKKEFDLSKYFKKISMECQEGAFVPDILLEAENQEKMFFEVVVTHSSSQEKIRNLANYDRFPSECAEKSLYLSGALNCPINLSSCTFSTLDKTEPPTA